MLPIISCHIAMILCHTTTVFCEMPTTFSDIFRIHAVMRSIWCVMGIVCSVMAIIHSVIFTISSAMLWISCLWFIIQPIPTVILELLFHPSDSLCPSYNWACDVHNSFFDPNKIFCHPYLLCKWAFCFSYDVMSICCWVSEQWYLLQYIMIIFLPNSTLV